MKASFILAALVAAVSATPAHNIQERNTLCHPHFYEKCCGVKPIPKRDVEERDNLCKHCICLPASTTPATTPATTPSTTKATTPVTNPTTTAPAQPSPSSCAALGNGATVGGYRISCATDFPGGDLSNAPSPNFAGCAPQCDALPGCLGFSYVGGNNAGVCYFKSSQTGGSPNSNVDSGFRSAPVTPPKPSTTTAQTTPAATTPATTPVTTPAPSSTGVPGSCPAANKPPAGYTVSCNTDRPGGDLSNAPSSSFAMCATQCNALAGCVGFAYVGGSGPGVCYFKSALTNSQSDPNVDFAARNSVTPPTSTTTTAKPQYTCLCPAVTF